MFRLQAQPRQEDQAAKTATATDNKTATTPNDDEEPATAPPPGAGRGSSDRRPRRGAVSAEVYSEDDATNYVKTVSYTDCATPHKHTPATSLDLERSRPETFQA